MIRLLIDFWFGNMVLLGFLNREMGYLGYKQETAFIDAGISSEDSYPKAEL